MTDEGTSYICKKCKRKVIYGLQEAVAVVHKYGRIICRWCLGRDKNGEIRRKGRSN